MHRIKVLCVDKEIVSLLKSSLSLLRLARDGRNASWPVYSDQIIIVSYPDGNRNEPVACDTTQKDLVPFWRPGLFARGIKKAINYIGRNEASNLHGKILNKSDIWLCRYNCGVWPNMSR